MSAPWFDGAVDPPKNGISIWCRRKGRASTHYIGVTDAHYDWPDWEWIPCTARPPEYVPPYVEVAVGLPPLAEIPECNPMEGFNGAAPHHIRFTVSAQPRKTPGFLLKVAGATRLQARQRYNAAAHAICSLGGFPVVPPALEKKT